MVFPVTRLAERPRSQRQRNRNAPSRHETEDSLASRPTLRARGAIRGLSFLASAPAANNICIVIGLGNPCLRGSDGLILRQLRRSSSDIPLATAPSGKATLLEGGSQ